MIRSLTLTLVALLMSSHSAAQEEQPTDAGVTDVVDRELLFDDAVSAHLVDVQTSDGIVTLTGTVDHLLSQERAARIAEPVKGVRSVVNRIEVRPADTISNEELQGQIVKALLNDPAADSYEVSVEVVKDGHVVLSGRVDSWEEKELSAKVAKGVRGVRALTNDIDITYGVERPDAEIEHDIEQALRWNALVDHELIEVQVEDGRVRLSGTAGSAAEKRQTYRTAWTSGVVSIDDSELEVERWARDHDLRKTKYVMKSEDEIRGAIKDALVKDPRVFSFNVTPSVSGNVATLRGVVDNLGARRAAEQVAKNTVGVGLVSNYLKVRPAEERAEDVIEKDIRASFLRDPYVDRYEITVEVHDGTVHLYGMVDSFFEKAQADDLAARIDGVTDVSNHLVVDDEPYAYDPYVDDWHIYGFDWYDHEPSFTYVNDRVIEAASEAELLRPRFVQVATVTGLGAIVHSVTQSCSICRSIRARISTKARPAARTSVAPAGR